ncbi:hypothetical protein D3C78_1042480 [compost metagenome]
MPSGASCGTLISFSGCFLPVNVRKTSSMLYTKVKMLAIQAITGNNKPRFCMLSIFICIILITAVKNISLLRNPLNGGSPAIENAPIKATEKVIGMIVINPPSLRMSLVPVS